MPTIPFPRLMENPMPTDAEQPFYAPEVLPVLDDLQNFANHLAQQVQSINTSGQLIVKDHRYTLELLKIEADTLEQEKYKAINDIYRSYDAMVADINARFDASLSRNFAMQQKTEAMISYFTSDAPPVGVLEIQPRKPKTLLGFKVG